MPIYEYTCAGCDSEFELEQRITEGPIKSCPSCRSKRVKRLISRTSFALKGGGWYSDGYGSSGGKDSRSGDDAAASSTSASGSDSSSDSESPKKSSDTTKDTTKDKDKDKKAVA